MYAAEGFDPTDEHHVKVAEKIDNARRELELADIRKVLAMPEGRRLFWKYLSECGIFKSSMTGNNHTFYNEGKRSIGLKMLAELCEAEPDAFVIMQKEDAMRSALEKNKLLKELNDVSTS